MRKPLITGVLASLLFAGCSNPPSETIENPTQVVDGNVSADHEEGCPVILPGSDTSDISIPENCG